MQNSLSIIGAGAWGSALSIALAGNFKQIWLHTHTQQSADNATRKHHALNVAYPQNVHVTFDLSHVKTADSILIATPSYGFANALNTLKPYLSQSQNIAWATKGFDIHNRCLLHTSFENIITTHASCVISGPSFAFEVAHAKPTALVVASKNSNLREYWAQTLHTNALRAYTNQDIIGVEVGGAIKNILAIAAGIAAGLGFGANTQAALITRGLTEMIRFGQSQGARAATFNGLSGLGDLVLTCSDDLSRNRQLGRELAHNHSLKQAISNVGATVEGINSLELVLEIAHKHQVEMPICTQVLRVVQDKITPAQAVIGLMSRKQINE